MLVTPLGGVVGIRNVMPDIYKTDLDPHSARPRSILPVMESPLAVYWQLYWSHAMHDTYIRLV